MSLQRITLAAIAAATCAVGATHTRADVCELSWDVPCCIVPGTNVGTATATLTICNCTGETALYGFNMDSPVAGVTFSPWTMVLSLEAGECIDIPIDITCPVGAAGTSVPFTAEVANIDTQQVFTCMGTINPVLRWKVEAIDPVVAGQAMVGGGGTPLDAEFVIHNLGSIGKDGIDIDFIGMGGVTPTEPTIHVNQFPVGESRLIRTTVMMASPRPPGAEGPGEPVFGDLLIAWDDNNDGTSEVLSSMKFQLTSSCPGDLNGDGAVNGADLASLLANWGLCN